MWGKIYTEYSLHTNFNVGFTSHKNDVHIQLSQWQYWWWFWFAAVWALYFLVILRCYNSKIENYNVTLNTSLRSHGKWGDFLVALIPLSWCGNILVNSNFILRMLEWQNESSLFVVRIQGKQWYWAYKYNSDTGYKLNNVFFNVGNNNWLKIINSSSMNFFNQNALLSFIYDYEFKQIYKKKLKKSSLLQPQLNRASLFSNLNIYEKFLIKNVNKDTLSIIKNYKNITKLYYKNNFSFFSQNFFSKVFLNNINLNVFSFSNEFTPTFKKSYISEKYCSCGQKMSKRAIKKPYKPKTSIKIINPIALGVRGRTRGWLVGLVPFFAMESDSCSTSKKFTKDLMVAPLTTQERPTTRPAAKWR